MVADVIGVIAVMLKIAFAVKSRSKDVQYTTVESLLLLSRRARMNIA